jgi:hypothetical protein
MIASTKSGRSFQGVNSVASIVSFHAQAFPQPVSAGPCSWPEAMLVRGFDEPIFVQTRPLRYRNLESHFEEPILISSRKAKCHLVRKLLRVGGNYRFGR